MLEATTAAAGRPLFGAPAVAAGARAYLPPGTGGRSLVGVVVPAERMTFTATPHDGRTDFRVLLPLPEVGERVLAVKDHHLSQRVEAACPDAAGRGRALAEAVRAMGPRVAVRLGLSRAFSAGEGCPEGCWVMANGFFAMDDPQP